MLPRWQGFAVPKRGNSNEEYEDAFAADPKGGRFAIADGASESSFASQWARILAEGYIKSSLNLLSKKDWLGPLQTKWSEEVGNEHLTWYADAKKDLGASATFLGLTLKRVSKGVKGSWFAFSAGDCCSVQLHKNRVVSRFPNLQSKDFDNHPKL